MQYPEFSRLVDVISNLRDPENGCPWDLKQTHRSLLKYLIEESYEFVHAAKKLDPKKMEEEIGDVLLQVLLHSQIAKESGHFDIESVSKVLADKMVRRHPHVFEDKSLAQTPEEVTENWESIKAKEKEKKQRTEKTFREEDAYLPSLMAAEKIGKKSQTVNFDWDTVEQVFVKVEEELGEVQMELKADNRSDKRLKEEVGDLLFSVTQLSRHLGFDAEETLREANLKFIRRFGAMEDKAIEDKLDMSKMSVPELEELWQAVKKELKKKQ